MLPVLFRCLFEAWCAGTVAAEVCTLRGPSAMRPRGCNGSLGLMGHGALGPGALGPAGTCARGPWALGPLGLGPGLRAEGWGLGLSFFIETHRLRMYTCLDARELFGILVKREFSFFGMLFKRTFNFLKYFSRAVSGKRLNLRTSSSGPSLCDLLCSFSKVVKFR